MAYQIVRISPTFDPSTSALTGSKESFRSHPYETAALALYLAAQPIGEQYGDDDFLVVVPEGGSAFGTRIYGSVKTACYF